MFCTNPGIPEALDLKARGHLLPSASDVFGSPFRAAEAAVQYRQHTHVGSAIARRFSPTVAIGSSSLMADQQRRLFDTTPEKTATPWESDDAGTAPVATVVFPEGLTTELDYLIPPSMGDRLQPGCRVVVPLGRGNRSVTAYCVACDMKTVDRSRFKRIARLVDRAPLLSAEMLDLTRWIADHYVCPWGQVLQSVVPMGVRSQSGTRGMRFVELTPEAPTILAETELRATQAAVLRALEESKQPLTPTELARKVRCSMSPIQTLRKNGILRYRTVRAMVHGQFDYEGLEETNPLPSSGEAGSAPSAPGSGDAPGGHPDVPELTDDQTTALATILDIFERRVHETALLHGVTGSGKTEVYIRAIEHVLRCRRQAIVLVPEISLTPQTVGRFRRRLGEVAVLHSHLTDAQRHWQWQRIASGDVPVVVGARSAIFAPVPRLGLVIIDEEHESSFKQATTPCYHARDVAIQRTRRERVPLILGSATPSLESWHRARQGVYRMVSMPRRVRNLPLPIVRTIDLRQPGRRRHPGGPIHRKLEQEMRTALAAGGQIILLLNRRGFSTHIQCPACGVVVKCPDCDIALTHHRTEDRALCHYCDHQIPAPPKCLECGFLGVRYSGLGTQRLENEVAKRFPDARCLRMDTDTMRRRGAHEQALDRFRAGQIDILLGTQMIAKGLDFPNVTLVGVIDADTALHLPDFRAAERTFHLLTQVAGRTGRGQREGLVIVQTYSPEHFAVQAATRHDFHAFAEAEVPLRAALKYPPFSAMARVIVRGEAEKATEEFAAALGKTMQATDTSAQALRLLGPAPAPLAKLRGYFRFHLQLHADRYEVIQRAATEARQTLRVPETVQWVIDVDPVDML